MNHPTISYRGMDWVERTEHPIKEYDRIRNDSGWLALPFSTLTLSGADNRSFLQGLGAIDFRKGPVGTASTSLFLDSSGKIQNEALVVFETQKLHLLAGPNEIESLRNHLEKYHIMEDVRFEEGSEPWQLWLGPEASEALEHVPKWATAWAGVEGFLTHGDPKESQTNLEVGLTAVDILRTESFQPWFAIEIQPGNNPLIYGKGTIDYNKGCFLGQETVAMTRDRGRPPKILAQIEAEDARFPEADQELQLEGKTVGQVIHGHISPQSQRGLAFALLKYGIEKGQVLLDQSQAKWTVQNIARFQE